MAFSRVDLVFIVVVVAMGLRPSQACKKDEVMSCTAPMLAFSQSPPTHDICKIIKDASDCLDRTTADCPRQMDSIIKVAKSGLNTYLKICKNPDSVDVQAMANCDATKINKCREELQRSPRNKKAKCLAIRKAEQCMNDFRKECDSDLLNDIFESVNNVIKQYQSKCPVESYYNRGGDSRKTGNGGGGGYQAAGNKDKKESNNRSSQLQSTIVWVLASAMIILPFL